MPGYIIVRAFLFFMLSGIAASLIAQDYLRRTGESISLTDPGIHTVLFFTEGREFSLPVLQMGSSQRLICKFDHLSGEARNYYYTIVQCDAEWNPSRLVSSEYMEGFQENPVNDYAFSINTTIPYVNYRIILPNDQVKILLSGNYLLKVWEDSNKEQPVMVRPFYVTETVAELSGEVQKASFEGYNGPSQQIAFAVNYQKLNVTDPLNEIKTVVMQNRRRDNMLFITKPTFIRQNQLLYEEKSNLFKGGNEFRNFNAKNLQTNGMGIRAIEYQDPWYHLFLEKDLSARTESYSFRGDLNGNFLVKNDRASDNDLESDYVYVHFTLQPPDLVTNDLIYIFGALTDWKCQAANQMIYQPDTKLYEATLLLKQGFYDYQYAFIDTERKSIDATFLEGSHVETENDYHLFVYYRGFSSRYDRLIGYRVINSVKR
ncbi:MAG: DUF5103 domain-containing protein [Prolixibacteraceae bacterium]|nr:DUF5103 domain-containing protein [Prolixibacteraceae bacterium]